MTCGTCEKPMPDIQAWFKHIQETGCNWRRDVWVKVMEAKRRGSSGLRHLTAAFPWIYKSKLMSEETKERFRELAQKRKGMKIRRSTRKETTK